MMSFVSRIHPVTACADRGDRDDGRDVRLKNQERLDSVVGRK